MIGQLNENEKKFGALLVQAIVSYKITWKVISGSPYPTDLKVRTKLHQVDLYPDLRFKKGEATSTYFVYRDQAALSNLARSINTWVENHAFGNEGTDMNRDNLNYKITISANKMVYRGFSEDLSDRHRVTFMASTDFVKDVAGEKINNWDKVTVKASGNIGTVEVTSKSEPNIKSITDTSKAFLVEQIMPSLQLSFYAEVKRATIGREKIDDVSADADSEAATSKEKRRILDRWRSSLEVDEERE